MSLNNIVGLDHVVVVTRDLDRAAETWRRLGFTVSPRGTHSAQMGTGNYTIMLGPDYIELLGVLADTELNAPTRAFLAQREGIERAAFTAVDASAGVEELKARGIAAVGPVAFGRPVRRPDGGEAEAKFRVFLWPFDATPGGMRIFACQHLTREAVWIPELQRHANTARRLVRLEIVASDPEKEAQHMRRLIDDALHAENDGAFRVPSGGDRADFVFLTAEALARRHPGVSLQGMPERGAAALTVEVADLDAAARAVGSAGITASEAVSVAPSAANGVLLRFVGA